MARHVADTRPVGKLGWRTWLFRAAAGLLLGALALSGGAVPWPPATPVSHGAPRPAGPVATVSLDKLREEQRRLRRALARLAPQGPYLVVDTAENVLYLKSGDRIIHRAVASTGARSVLADPSGNRRWVFETPRGVFRVWSRLLNPVWVKPDWAFLEEGTPIPRDPAARLEPGVLGDYALGFGNGYFLHGTLYTRLLGQNVTHGCIRLADKDLRKIYRAAPLGTPIFIY